jgi:cation diffusion facilitator family transporter
MQQSAMQGGIAGHRHRGGPLGWLAAVLHLHGHEHAEANLGIDPAMATREGTHTVWIALAVLGLTTLLQLAIVVVSGSVALLADTVHNLGDALNSVPLLIAFYLARRLATRRYTYGYGRAEDVAGVLIVLSILFSAGYILWESFWKLLDPQPIERLPWVAAAAVIGFLGNEAVALFQIQTGRRIGSESLVVDGLHARIDGLTSLVVLLAVAGSALGYPIVDPIVGLLIGVAIVFIARDATRRIWYRLMDAVDPLVVERIEQYAGDVPGVDQVASIRVRWVGHQLFAEVGIVLSASGSAERERIVQEVRDTLLTYVRHLALVTIEVLPQAAAGEPAGRRTLDGLSILPPRYQDATVQVSAAPMGAAALEYDEAGEVAWDEMWTGFCELALAGGAPHRGTLLEPVHEEAIAANPEQYEWVLHELERGIALVTGLPVVRSATPGWIGMQCDSEQMALWLLRAIVVENVTVRREDAILWFPAGPEFRLEREIKNVITVIAKTNHYWEEHIAGGVPVGVQ